MAMHWVLRTALVAILAVIVAKFVLKAIPLTSGFAAVI